MASHQVAIAKASFSAALLRPDPHSVARDSIEHFHSLLHNTVNQCSPKNVQKCKYWILENVAQSAARFTSLGKYLTALVESFTTSSSSKEKREPSIKRKRLHVLYLINDILHHGKFYNNDASISGKVQPLLMSLVGSAAALKDCPKHQKKVQDLLSIWEQKDYYSSSYVDKLREAAKNASEGRDAGDAKEQSSVTAEGTAKSIKDAPYVMPASHGDATTPWFDLPAANMMPHIVPNSTKPINPDMIKPLQFIAGPADELLVDAVKGLLEEVETIFGDVYQEDKDTWDIDELGQPIILDEVTNDVIGGDGYYGWSRTFCEKMNRKRKGLDISKQDEDRGRSRSSSRSIRKRRYSNSSSQSSQERYRSRPRRRSYSSSRSPTPDQSRIRRSREDSRDRNFSRQPPTPPRHGESHSVPPPPPPPSHPSVPYPQPPFQPGFNANFPPPPPPPNLPYNNGIPPPPFNGQAPPFGVWPPPPPNLTFNQSQQWPPPPPPGNPPPFASSQQHQQNIPSGHPFGGPGNWQQPGEARGYNNNHSGWNSGPPNRGRGGFRGRGRGW